jgi:hypothetical protein
MDWFVVHPPVFLSLLCLFSFLAFSPPSHFPCVFSHFSSGPYPFPVRLVSVSVLVRTRHALRPFLGHAPHRSRHVGPTHAHDGRTVLAQPPRRAFARALNNHGGQRDRPSGGALVRSSAAPAPAHSAFPTDSRTNSTPTSTRTARHARLACAHDGCATAALRSPCRAFARALNPTVINTLVTRVRARPPRRRTARAISNSAFC